MPASTQLGPTLFIAVFALLGLLVGSFLNLLIHRLPRMLQAQWAAQCAEMAGTPMPTVTAPRFNLMLPRSRCPQCARQLLWFQNIPLLSYLALRGRCACCRQPIGIRYPVVELASAAFFMLAASRHGATPAALLWSACASILIAQFCIDLDTQLLPDDLNYPLLWTGLLAATLGWIALPLPSALWGAMLGYASLWTVTQAHHLLTGRTGMGNGDFKLLAALGAWFGADHLVALILLSSVAGSVVGGVLLLSGKIAGRHVAIPFGPFLAGAGLLAIAAGPGRLERWLPMLFPFSGMAG